MTPWIVFHGVSSVRPPTGTGGKTIFPGSTIGHFYKKDSLLNTYIKKKTKDPEGSTERASVSIYYSIWKTQLPDRRSYVLCSLYNRSVQILVTY